ncbi:S66 peptidase family protein [Abyssalbus ytuae]|uniref:LD-carboxypeptidase n=1 Tax=Abyssalbus ytuae TaxID=2926907 RepID=A0A9E6ZIG0_9FLAO|nr:LD-carboxypeptidase [Abyssalbus ytuae]UOB16124.1 LD-carboxypeptidase [Abyssalbus ytuae]
MRIPKKNRVWIISTARKITHEEIQPSIKLLESWNLEVCTGETIGAEYHQFAGNDNLRVKDFQKALNDPRTRAIWCARGGYGTVRIIDAINFSEYSKNPIPIIGYSDVTVLHSHLHNLGFESIHATMPINIEENSEASVQSLKDILDGKDLIYKISSSEINRGGNAKGKLVGGNLSILYSLMGSESAINTDGKILFIEDLDEYLYHIDRMLISLKRNGYFENLKGLIVGSFTKIHDNTIPFGKTAEEIIRDVVEEYDFPVIFNFPAGHIDDNRALIMGREVMINVNASQAVIGFV